MLIPAPLYHKAPVRHADRGQTDGRARGADAAPPVHPEATLKEITREGQLGLTVPTMMNRIWHLPDDGAAAYDPPPSVETLWHTLAARAVPGLV